MESDPIVNYITRILAKMTTPSAEKTHLGVFGELGWSRVLEQTLFSFEVLKVICVMKYAELTCC